jgi:hypothetical protein
MRGREKEIEAAQRSVAVRCREKEIEASRVASGGVEETTLETTKQLSK